METVGISACSNALNSRMADTIEEVKTFLGKSGRNVIMSSCVYEKNGIFSGTGKEKAQELMKLFSDSSVEEIYDVSGGDMANEVLDYLDFEKIKKSRAVFFGYSDLTTVINAIYEKTGKSSVLYQIRNIADEEYGTLQKNRYLNRKELYNPSFELVQGNGMKGVVVGGNIRCFLKLAGTEYLPDLTDKILLLESMGGKVPQMVTYLSQLRSLGAFKKVKGILLGTFVDMESYGCEPDIVSLVTEFAGGEIPVAVTREIGHYHDSKAIWIGREIEIRKEVPEEKTDQTMNKQKRAEGCLIGGAAGDALGYTIEFLGEKSIFGRYGSDGITEFELIDGIAEISDDTQMTLFTAEGLILNKEKTCDSYTESIKKAYKVWYRTQMEDFPIKEQYSRLAQIPELFSRRAPGMTCLSALGQENCGTIKNRINDSKGCGGIMRVAPIGLFFEENANLSLSRIDRMGAEAAALTHGHSLGFIPAAALVHLINVIVYKELSLQEAVDDMILAMEKEFKGDRHLEYFIKLMHRASELAKENISDLDAIHSLGEGWVAEETLAIAIYCALRYENNFEKALITSVNHRGDSDSTGAVTGNILGAYLGINAVPVKFKDKLELREILIKIADFLAEYKVTFYKN